MKYLIILLLALFSTVDTSIADHTIEGLSKECKKNPMFGHFYRQQKYDTSNHEEDMILASLGLRYAETLLDQLHIRKLDTEARQTSTDWIEKNCSPFTTSMVFGSEDLNNLGEYLSEPEMADLESCRFSQQEKTFEELNCKTDKIIYKSPVTVKSYTNKFQAVINDYELKNKSIVFKSEPHHWDKKNVPQLIKKFPAALTMSKLLATLAMGATSRFMATEKDKDLRQWLIDQPMSSVLPEDLLKKSLELQKGDIYKAILSVENVLSEYWLAPDRQFLKQTSALKSITHYCPDTKSLDGSYGGTKEFPEDTFGAYYHLFGTMLLGCAEGPVTSTIVGMTESLGGRVLDLKKAKEMGHNLVFHMVVGTDPQEEKINKRGGLIGHNICKNAPRNYFKDTEIENPKVINLGALWDKKQKLVSRIHDCKDKACFICDTKKCEEKLK